MNTLLICCLVFTVIFAAFTTALHEDAICVFVVWACVMAQIALCIGNGVFA